MRVLVEGVRVPYWSLERSETGSLILVVYVDGWVLYAGLALLHSRVMWRRWQCGVFNQTRGYLFLSWPVCRGCLAVDTTDSESRLSVANGVYIFICRFGP